ncbi:MAG: acetyl-CoA C-acetyltransferase [Betaproteobacteria bacterium]|nr:acetyl-CoA C-acetyltransferase [Betaproteobacteria bacterium]
MNPNTLRRVAIVGGNRIPFARSNTAYVRASNLDMLTTTLQGLVDRFGLHGQRLGDVAAGAVMKHSRDFNLVREAVLSTTLSPETPAFDLQQACGTGLEAAMLVAHKIAVGQIDSGIAGGVDTTSDAPIALNEKLRRTLLDLSRARTGGQRLRSALRIRPSQFFKPVLPRNGEPRTGLSMGEHAQLMARQWDIAREAQDALALESHHKLAQAYDSGFFVDLMTPFQGLREDNNLRRGLTAEQLAKLKPVFDRQVAPGEGTLTAGNSTPLTDGASAVLLASEAWAAARGLPVLAYLSFSEVAAVDFFNADPAKKEGLLMAPAYAVPRMLQRAGLTLQDFDFYEIHEAFAAQVLCTLQAWESPAFCRDKLGLSAPLGAIDRSKLNVLGSSLAAGHPFAATGGRIIATLAKLLAQKGHGRGLISICAAGGQGVVAIVEA